MEPVGVDAGDRGLLLGREEELVRLRGALVDSAGGLVVGPAGIGKSHLLAAVTVQVEGDGREVIVISGAQSAASVPLAPLLQLVDLRDVEDLGTAVMAELARRGRGREVMLVVDDAHLLDQDSAAVVNQAVVGEFACVLLAARSEEVLAPGLEALWRDGFVERLDLGPLDRAASELITAQLLGEVAPPVHEWLWERSQGHPLFLRELIRALGRAELELEEIELGEEIDFPDVPQRLTDLIGSYLNDLDSSELHALAAVSLTQPVDRSVIERVSSPLVVDRLVRRDLVREYRAGLAVSHPLYGEVSEGRLTSDEARDLRIHLADHLSREVGKEIQVTTLLLDSGTRPPLPTLTAALDEALTLRQPKLARSLAAELVEIDPGPENLAKLAAAHAMSGDWDTADELYRKAVGQLQPENDAAAVWLPWIRSTFEHRKDPGRARAIAQQAMQELTGADQQVAKAYWLRARMFVEPLEPVFAELKAMRDDQDLHSRALATVGVDVAGTAWHMCRPREGLRASVPLETSERSSVDVVRIHEIRCVLAMWSLGLKPAIEFKEELSAFAETTKDPYAQLIEVLSGMIIRGRAEHATRVVDNWVELQRLSSRSLDRRWIAIALAEAALAYSCLRDSEDECLRTLGQIAGLPPGAAYVTSPFVAIAESRLAHREGRLDEAERSLVRGVSAARERNAYAYEMLCLRELFQLGAGSEELHSRMADIAERAGPGLARIMADQSGHILDGDAEGLVGVSVTAEEYGASGIAWESAATAHALFQQNGDHRAAFECELRVGRLSEAHPNQISPAVERMEPTLTPSQSEVAALSATGATNAEIGDELFISPHTVKRHLEDIYKRLGISGRDDLAEMYQIARRGEISD